MRCCSVRFAAYYVLPFYVALSKTGHIGWNWVLFGAIFWLLHSLGTESVNRISDQVEDRANRLTRTTNCDTVGFRTLKVFSITVWIAIGTMYAGWLIGTPNPILAILLISRFMAGINYSLVIRFKGRRYLSNLVLTLPFIGPFLVGWSVFQTFSSYSDWAGDLFFNVMPLILIVGLFIGTFAGIKDITDVEGDIKTRYRSFWVSLIEKNDMMVIIGLISSPFTFAILLTLTNVLPDRFLYLLVFWPVSLALASLARGGIKVHERSAVRESFYQYWIIFTSSALYLYHPASSTVWLILGTYAYWIFASYFLHWSRGLELREVLGALRDSYG